MRRRKSTKRHCIGCDKELRIGEYVYLDIVNGIHHATCFIWKEESIMDKGTYEEIISKYPQFFSPLEPKKEKKMKVIVVKGPHFEETEKKVYAVLYKMLMKYATEEASKEELSNEPTFTRNNDTSAHTDS